MLFLATQISPVSLRGSISSSLITWSTFLSSLSSSVVALIGLGQLLSTHLCPSRRSWRGHEPPAGHLRGFSGVVLGEGGVQSHLPHPTGNGQREAQGSWVIPGSAVRCRLKPHQAPFPCLCSTDSFARFRSLWNVAKGRKDRWFQQFWSSPPRLQWLHSPGPSGSRIPVFCGSQGLEQQTLCPVQS